MKKVKNQPKAALGAAVADMPTVLTIVDSETAKPQEQEKPQAEEAPKTLEEVLAENEKLKSALKNQPQTLEEKIDFYNRKKEFIKQLAVVDKKRETVFQAFEMVTTKAEEDEFFTDSFSLVINHKATNYGKEDEIVKVNNPVVIGELLQFVLSRMDVKRDELQYLIEA